MCRYEEPGGSDFLVADRLHNSLPPWACKQFIITVEMHKMQYYSVQNKTATKDALISYQQHSILHLPPIS